MFLKPCKSTSKVEVKRKHVTPNSEQKLEIIRRIRKGENRNKLMEEFNIGSSAIYDIKKNKDQFFKFVYLTVIVKDIQSC